MSRNTSLEPNPPSDLRRSSFPARNQGWAPFEALRQEMDRIFDYFGEGDFRDPLQRMASSLSPSRLSRLNPAVDVKETDSSYDLSVELAGMDEKDVQLTVDGHLLTLSGRKNEENERKGDNYHLTERRFGSFSRSFRIPENADASKVEAKLAKGILTVHIPKLAEAQSDRKTIPVKTA